MIQFHPVQFPRASQAAAAISEKGGVGNGGRALQRRPPGGFPPLLLPPSASPFGFLPTLSSKCLRAAVVIREGGRVRNGGDGLRRLPWGDSQPAHVLRIPSPLQPPAGSLPLHQEANWRWGDVWEAARVRRQEGPVEEQEGSCRCSVCAHQ
jgi:hypothetical protein